MRSRFGIMFCAVLCGVASRANAEPFSDNEIVVVEVEGQNDKATLTTMPWCPAGKYTGESWDKQRLRRQVSGREDYERWAEAATVFCEHKEDPTWHKQATGLVQLWMNSRQKTQEEAEAEIIKKIAKMKGEKENEGKPVTDEQKFAFTAAYLVEVKPYEGVDQAKIGAAPAWCDAAGKFEKSDIWEPGRIHRTFEVKNEGIDNTITAALHICQRPTDPTWKTAAGYILQYWMNMTRQSQPDAEKSLRARIQRTKFEAERKTLCDALEVDPEVGGQAKTYGEAKRQLFGCEDKGHLLWQGVDRANESGVQFYLDGDTHVDELMRLYWLFGFVADPSGREIPDPSSSNTILLYYAVAQFDLAKVDLAALDKLVSGPPYNAYAHLVINETVSVLKAEQRVYEKIIDKMTKGDADYTAILRTAPKQAFAQWDQMVAQWKPEFERSVAFEQKFSSKSRSALKGCSAELAKDVEKVIKSFKTKEYKTLVDKIAADPVANVLLRRASWCFAIDKVPGASGALRELVEKGRNLRGPRSLAFYAIVDAVAEAKKDRPRLLFDVSSSGFNPNGSSVGSTTNLDLNFDFTGRVPGEWEHSDEQGVVASTKKLADGLEVVFKKVISTYEDVTCVDDTRHPLRIASDGRIEYYRNCKPNGQMLINDHTPATFVVPPLLTAGIKPGVYLRYVPGVGPAKGGVSFGLPMFTKAKAADKKITSFFGFPL